MNRLIRGAVLTGTIGAGKTALAESISETLHENGIRHALVELDWLGQVYPIPYRQDPYGYDLALRNLAVTWPNFVDAGITHAVIAGTILNHDLLQRLQAATPGTQTDVVLVQAPSELVHRRITERNSGALLNDFLERTDSVAATIAAAGIHNVKISNDSRPLHEVTHELLQQLDAMKERASAPC